MQLCVRRTARTWTLVFFWALCIGCEDELVGERCTEEDEAQARTVVYSADGLPAYVGQALLLTSCGGGSFCHSEGAVDRVGVPRGLDFDAQLADQFLDSLEGARRLRRIQLSIYRHKDAIWSSVSEGSMPPGRAGARAAREPFGTFDARLVRTPIAGLDTREGREQLRTWLACGAPVIERTSAGPGTVCGRDADCPLSNQCDVRRRLCVGVGTVVPRVDVPLDPTWESIWRVVLKGRCAQGGCHGGGDARAALDFSDRDAAYDALVGVPAAATSRGGLCEGEGLRVAPGDADRSILVAKLVGGFADGRAFCGARMPLSPTPLPPRQLAVIREWISAGASR